MLFIWDVFLGAPVALRQRSHFIIDLFNGKRSKTSIFCDVLSDLLIFVFLYIMIIYGSTFVEITSTMYYSYIYVPQAIVTISVPVSGTIMLMMNLENFIKDAKAFINFSTESRGQ